LGQASNGLEALALYDTLHPDFVMLDILMGDMDGVECCQRLYAKDPQCKVVFVSALPNAALIAKRLPKPLPEALFVRKPLVEASLQQALQTLFAVEAPPAPPKPPAAAAKPEAPRKMPPPPPRPAS